MLLINGKIVARNRVFKFVLIYIVSLPQALMPAAKSGQEAFTFNVGEIKRINGNGNIID